MFYRCFVCLLVGLSSASVGCGSNPTAEVAADPAEATVGSSEPKSSSTPQPQTNAPTDNDTAADTTDETQPAQLADASSDTLEHATLDDFFNLIGRDGGKARASLKVISERWRPAYATMLVEMLHHLPRNSGTSRAMLQFLQANTKQNFGYEYNKWYKWIWKHPYQPHPQYAEFKSKLLTPLDPTFGEYFVKTDNASVRLDEVRWGGVRRDGIPPLDKPKMLSAKEATYLDDSNVVFGIEFNGDARCYPKRILAHHEMFKDTIGGQSVCGVY